MERSATLIPIPVPDRPGFGFYLELGGVKVGFVAAGEGGDISANLVRDPSGPETFVRKRIGSIGYEGITLRFGLGMAKPLYEWIAESWAGKAAPRSGALLSVDHDLQINSRREFKNALVTETSIPPLNGASKDAALISMRITPDSTGEIKTAGKVPGPDAKLHRWMTSNFRLEIAGLDASRARAVDGFVVRSSPRPSAPGAKIDFPDLRVWVAAAFADPWRAWFDDFVVRGHNDATFEKAGALVFLAPDRETDLGRIALDGLGIRRLGQVHATSEDTIPSIAADLYCQRMRFVPK